ncbi:MAG: PhnD/SsuA/transferrin family substrate-binding protein [Burkholderiaceae bacterium]
MSVVADSWRLALPMYAITPALGAAWEDVLRAVIAGLRQRGFTGDMQLAAPTGDLMAWWRAPDMLLSQTCGYPLVTQLQSDVQVLGVLEFDLPGCSGGEYRSMILVPASGARSLAALRGAVAVINQWDSHSGMNALRHTMAPLAQQGRFFSQILVSGSHMESIAMLQRGEADVAAVDCVTFGLAERAAPDRVAGVRVLQTTAPAPGLPLITARALRGDPCQVLREVLLAVHEQAPDAMRALAIRRVRAMQLADYAPIKRMIQRAADLGYHTLA